MDAPTRFSRCDRRYAKARAICWFRPTAAAHIAWARALAALLRRNGIVVKEIRTRRAGYVVYEDRYQVCAEPFRREASAWRSR